MADSGAYQCCVLRNILGFGNKELVFAEEKFFIELCVGKIKGNVYFKFHKVHFRANSALLPTKGALL